MKLPKPIPPRTASRRMTAVHALGQPDAPTPQTRWARQGHGRGGEPSVAMTLPAVPHTPNPPGAPSLAQGAGSNLTVTWITPAIDSTHDAATGFAVRSSPDGAGTWTTVPGVTSPNILSGLAAGAAIDVQLQSSNVGGASAWSATATLTTAAAGPFAPNSPGALALAQGTGSNLTVTWTAPAIDSTHNAATGISLRSSPSGAGTWTVVPNISSPYTLTGLTAGAAFDVQLQSSNATGPSAWTSTSTLTTASAAPNTPGALSLAQGTGSNLTVSWTAPATDSAHGAATAIAVRSSPHGAGTWTTVPGVVSPYSLLGLAASSSIDVQLQSSNAIGTSAWSATSTLTTATAVPNPPTALTLAQGAGSDLNVTWTAPAIDSTHSAATAIALRSSPSGAGIWTTVSSVTSPYDLAGLAAGAAIDVQLQSSNTAGSAGWTASSTLTTASAGPNAPNVPAIAGVTPPPDGTISKLRVTWTPPAVDGAHDAATGYNVRSSPAGAGTWTTVSGVSSPYTVTGLSGATSMDVEVQASNAAASPSAWSSATTAKTWGATVAPGNWVAATTQVHSTPVAPNNGVQMTAVAAPTAVTGASFGWSASNSVVPTTGLITAPSDGQTNGWGQYFSAPATAGTWYLWSLPQGAGPVTIGALVTSAITVT